MEFRTPVTLTDPRPGLLNHAGNYLMLGSCFTAEMSTRLERDGFRVTANPGGPLFNPLSILRWVERLAVPEPFTEAELTQGPDGRYHTWMHHTLFSRPTPGEVLDAVNPVLEQSAQALREARAVFITLGSNRVFEINGRVVTNCHRHHPATFTERRITLDETIAALRRISDTIAAINPTAEIVWTVSPVRHPGQGGLHANALSKATLLLAIDALNRGIYFPAYEAVTDDLRDYRFFAADMRHPSPVAADYVYTLLQSALMTPATIEEALAARRLSHRASHCPNNPS